MPSVRKAPGFNELSPARFTFYYDSSIVYDSSDINGGNHSNQVGMAVALVSDSTVGLGAAGGIFRGALVAVESDGSCTVQVGGVCRVPYVAATPPIVGHGVTVTGAGAVTSAATPTAAETAAGAMCLSLDSVNLVAYVLIPV